MQIFSQPKKNYHKLSFKSVITLYPSSMKTHWLMNPNKNYLGHQDLPNGDDITVTIASAAWEAVENPKLGTKEEKRVVRFVENVKPFICNETNAATIVKVTKCKFMEETAWKQIVFFVSQTKVKGQTVDCIRIRDVAPKPKETLTTDHPKWNTAIQKVKEGADIATIRKYYNITEENFNLLSK